jgi:hypothetical protein
MTKFVALVSGGLHSMFAAKLLHGKLQEGAEMRVAHMVESKNLSPQEIARLELVEQWTGLKVEVMSVDQFLTEFPLEDWTRSYGFTRDPKSLSAAKALYQQLGTAFVTPLIGEGLDHDLIVQIMRQNNVIQAVKDRANVLRTMSSVKASKHSLDGPF